MSFIHSYFHSMTIALAQTCISTCLSSCNYPVCPQPITLPLLVPPPRDSRERCMNENWVCDQLHHPTVASHGHSPRPEDRAAISWLVLALQAHLLADASSACAVLPWPGQLSSPAPPQPAPHSREHRVPVEVLPLPSQQLFLRNSSCYPEPATLFSGSPCVLVMEASPSCRLWASPAPGMDP